MLLAAPERLIQMIPPDCREPVIIDEVQRVPELLNEVHRLIERKKKSKKIFVLFSPVPVPENCGPKE